MLFPRLLAVSALTCAMALPALAQDKAAMASIKARQGQMQMIAANMAVLGGMAKGAIPYDSAAATQAAEDLAAIGSISQAVLWKEGSDSFAMEGNRAEPKIWEDWAGFDAKWQDYATAASAAAASVGSGQEAIGPALGALGQSCKGCHEGYRTPE